MDERELARLFGDTSESLVPEAVWLWHMNEEEWPSWHEAVHVVASFALEKPDAMEEAEGWLLYGIAEGEVQAKLSEEKQWFISLSDEDDALITRRYLLRTMPRKETSE
jgi:hypothetical protein